MEILINELELQIVSKLKSFSIISLKKNKEVYQIMVQVGRLTYKKILEAGQVLARYDYCRVFEGMKLRHCFKCCNLRHLSKHCSRDYFSPINQNFVG